MPVIDFETDSFKVTLDNNIQSAANLSKGFADMRNVAFEVTGTVTAFFKSAVLYRDYTGTQWFDYNPLRSSRLRKMQRKWARRRKGNLVGYIDLLNAKKLRSNYRLSFQDTGVPFDG